MASVNKAKKPRPYITEYFDTENAQGKTPSSRGYPATLEGAKRAIANKVIVTEKYGLGVILNRKGTAKILHMKRTARGVTIDNVDKDDVQ